MTEHDDVRRRYEAARDFFETELARGLRERTDPRLAWLESLDAESLHLLDLADARAEARTLRYVLAGLLDADMDHRLQRVVERLAAVITKRLQDLQEEG